MLTLPTWNRFVSFLPTTLRGAAPDFPVLFAHLLQSYHYLGFRDVGRNMKYLALDRHNILQLPVKDIYLYPLQKDFARCLNRTSSNA